MSLRIHHQRKINAPRDLVWQVITDLPEYGEWNPFVVACESALQPNTPIHMKVRVLPWFAQRQTETIREIKPLALLRYGMSMPMGALASERQHRLYPNADGSTDYESHFQLTGWLASGVSALLGQQLERGFSEMTDAIVRRAERLLNPSPGT